MSLKWKIWLVSQGLLVITALIIQVVFHREIQVGPILGTEKRDYWDVIGKSEPPIPPKYMSRKADPKLYDARLPMTDAEALRRGLGKHRLAYRQEEGLRTAFAGAFVVNALYFLAFHLGFAYFRRQIRPPPSHQKP